MLQCDVPQRRATALHTALCAEMSMHLIMISFAHAENVARVERAAMRVSEMFERDEMLARSLRMRCGIDLRSATGWLV